MESSIRKVIKEKGFTLEQVASQMSGKEGNGISQSALTQMLNGNPSISRVKEIARIIGVSVSELVADDYLNGTGKKKTTIVCPHCGKEITLEVNK